MSIQIQGGRKAPKSGKDLDLFAAYVAMKGSPVSIPATIAELRLLKSMINPELTAQKKSRRRGGFIHGPETMVHDRERDKIESLNPTRKILITRAIGECLEFLVSRAPEVCLVPRPPGTALRATNFISKI